MTTIEKSKPTKTAKNFHAQSSDQVFLAFESKAHGLDEKQVTQRLQDFGENILATRSGKPVWKRLLEQFNSALIYVLIISGCISLALQHYIDSGVIFGVVLINALVGFIQEGKAEAALRAILAMTKTHCMVIREGALISIDSTQLVPGDIVYLQAGDRVPADLRLFYGKELRCDESALTGESQASSKHVEILAENIPLAERKNMAYMGTIVNSGLARGIVCATGHQTEIGAISDLVQQATLLKTPLQKQLSRFAKQLSLGILLLSIAVMLFGIFIRNYPFIDMIQAAIGIAVASIPEGLPSIVTITLAIGVQRMAKSNALVRRLPSVEVLGSVDVICSDKTGTLTSNAMTARETVLASTHYLISGEGYQPTGVFTKKDTSDQLLSGQDNILNRASVIALLCNDANLTKENDEWILHGDPTEGALMVMALKQGLSRDTAQHDWPRIDELPFETERRYMATLHQHMHQNTEGEKLVFIKGAPDRLLEYSTHQLSDSGLEAINKLFWQNALDTLAIKGMRVMALAQKNAPDNNQALSHSFIESQLTLIALVGISDPPRPEAIESIRLCHAAGIKVKMITGDNPVTASAIGKELGLNANKVLTGIELDKLSPEQLCDAAETVDIFARTSPNNKLQLVKALQERQHIVAMTGDGVNDAPALRQANIGVAMGKKGTDAAKEASDIVLTDDNFSTIERAVEEGRTVYANIVKSILFILPTSFAEASVIIAAIILGSILPITPPQILWVNMITAITLSLALAFELTEAGTMQQAPRKNNQGLITLRISARIILIGLAGAFIIYQIFSYYLAQGVSVEYARTIAVNCLVMIEAFYLFNCRFLYSSLFGKHFFHGFRPTFYAVLMVLIFQMLFTYLPISQTVFGLAAINFQDWLLLTLCALPILFIAEAERFLWALISKKNKNESQRISE